MWHDSQKQSTDVNQLLGLLILYTTKISVLKAGENDFLFTEV